LKTNPEFSLFSNQEQALIDELIQLAIHEDIAGGDHTSLACIPEMAEKKARLIVKESGTISGISAARVIFERIDARLKFEPILLDGTTVVAGDIAFTVEGSARSILAAERLVLNCMQRMSGIATQTRLLVNSIAHTTCTLLDTRKTAPGMRVFEKMAVRHGGAKNHRMGLYDMIMVKDNHIDYAGGITEAIERVKTYLKENNLELDIEVEARNLDDVKTICNAGGIRRVMFDNFSSAQILQGLEITKNYTIETEASGGINDTSLVQYAETGVQFISVGALTHQVRSLDLSLKAFE